MPGKAIVGKDVPMKQSCVRLLVACLMGTWIVSATRADGPGSAVGTGAVTDTTSLLTGEQSATVTGAPTCPAKLEDSDPFRAGALSFEFMSGYFVKSSLGPGGKPGVNPPLDYVPEAIRVGLMCNDPHPDWYLAGGVTEVLLEYNYLPVVRGFGNYFTGPNALLRYNAVRPDCALVPYGQIGAGFVLNDVWNDPVQHLIGEDFEFLLRAEGGVHLMISESLSMNIEAGYQHISNACLAPRNAGLNNVGAAIGFTWSFGR